MVKLICGMIIVLGTTLPTKAQLRADDNEDKVNPEVVSQLNLEDTQIDQLKKLRKSKKLELRNHMQGLKEARREFQQALQRNAGEQELKEKFQILQQARQALAQAKFEKMLEFRAVLTPEQRKKFQEMKAPK